jgi:hypothetical protein
MKAHPSASSKVHLDEWRFFYLFIVCLTRRFFLSLYCLFDNTYSAYNDDITRSSFRCSRRLLRQQDQTPNFAQPARDGEVKEIEKLERYVVFDMDRIQSAVRPLASSYPLTEINSHPLPGVHSFSESLAS